MSGHESMKAQLQRRRLSRRASLRSPREAKRVSSWLHVNKLKELHRSLLPSLDVAALIALKIEVIEIKIRPLRVEKEILGSEYEKDLGIGK